MQRGLRQEKLFVGVAVIVTAGNVAHPGEAGEQVDAIVSGLSDRGLLSDRRLFGHINAAGCSLTGTLEEVKEQILDVVKKSLEA